MEPTSPWTQALHHLAASTDPIPRTAHVVLACHPDRAVRGAWARRTDVPADVADEILAVATDPTILRRIRATFGLSVGPVRDPDRIEDVLEQLAADGNEVLAGIVGLHGRHHGATEAVLLNNPGLLERLCRHPGVTAFLAGHFDLRVAAAVSKRCASGDIHTQEALLRRLRGCEPTARSTRKFAQQLSWVVWDPTLWSSVRRVAVAGSHLELISALDDGEHLLGLFDAVRAGVPGAVDDAIEMFERTAWRPMGRAAVTDVLDDDDVPVDDRLRILAHVGPTLQGTYLDWVRATEFSDAALADALATEATNLRTAQPRLRVAPTSLPVVLCCTFPDQVLTIASDTGGPVAELVILALISGSPDDDTLARVVELPDGPALLLASRVEIPNRALWRMPANLVFASHLTVRAAKAVCEEEPDVVAVAASLVDDGSELRLDDLLAVARSVAGT